MSGAKDHDRLAVVPVHQSEVALPNSNNELVVSDIMPVLDVQENEGTFEHVSDDGQSKQTVQQQQRMVLRGRDTNDESVRVMEGVDQKAVLQENSEGKRAELIQERTMKSKMATATSQTQHELTEKKRVTGLNLKNGTRAVEIEAKKQETLMHKTEQEMLVKSAAQLDKVAVKQDNTGYQQGIRERREVELQAQVSVDGSKQVSGKFRNARLLSSETAEGTKIQFEQRKGVLGIDEGGELAIKDDESLMVEFTLENYLRDPKQFVQNEDVKNGFKGFLDILARQRKLPWSLGAIIVYKFGLLIFYFINFLYPIIVFAVEQENAAYNIVCFIISLIGLVYELYEFLPDLYHYMKTWNEKRRMVQAENDAAANKEKSCTEVVIRNQTEFDAEAEKKDLHNKGEPTNQQPVDSSENVNYSQKVKLVFKEFVVDSLGEFLIYPSIICGLYGFVNEKGWEFDSPIAVFDFLLLLYGIVMDVFYAKVIHVWLLQKIIRNSYKAHDEYEQIGPLGWKKILERIVTPFSMTIPYAIAVAIMHWLMLAIIGVRIYADNFSEDESDQSRSTTEEPPKETGDYSSAPYTRYMIFCGAYLPVVSMLTYVILNKYWFLNIYWLIKNNGVLSADSNKEIVTLIKYQYIKKMPESVKTMAFLRDPIAYIAVIFLMVPFIPFVVGTFLPDYSDSEMIDGAKSAAGGLGAIFIILFLLANWQAAIIFIIMAVLAVLTAIYILYALTHPKEMAKRAYRDYRDNQRR